MKRKKLVIGPLVLLVGTGVVTGLAVLWHKKLRNQFFPNNFGVVKENCIYRSARNTPRVLGQICRDKKLRTIVDLVTHAEDTRSEAYAVRKVAEEAGVKRYEFGLPGDIKGNVNEWAAVARLLKDPANYPLLVHCAAGSERTTVAVMLFRNFEEGVSFRDSYPESFDFKHKEKDWGLLAFLADSVADVEQAYRTDKPQGECPAETISAYAETFVKNPGKKAPETL